MYLEAFKPPHILQLRGLVIADAQGKPRVMLGAPMCGATSQARLRVIRTLDQVPETRG